MINFQIMYDEDKDELIILKPNNRQLVEKKIGKYGIEACVDIEGSVFGITIPEPSILFGFNDDILNNFINE